jgi:hypothetical protein
MLVITAGYNFTGKVLVPADIDEAVKLITEKVPNADLQIVETHISKLSL